LSDGVWDASDDLSGGNVVRMNPEFINVCYDLTLLEMFCPFISQMMIAKGEINCSKTVGELELPGIPEYFMGMETSVLRPRSVCCTELCKNVCPGDPECPGNQQTSTTTTTKPSMTSNYPAPAGFIVEMMVTIQGIDYEKVRGASEMQAKLVMAVKHAFLPLLPAGYTENEITVILSKGSVQASVHITTKSDAEGARIIAAVRESKASMRQKLAQNVKDIPRVENVLETGKAVSDIVVSAFPLADEADTHSSVSVPNSRVPGALAALLWATLL